jgi:predicted O-linked N-acetylglucosamine transferase (SPINDLY family)
MDYLIADRSVIAEDDRQFYAERIASLPGCYLPGAAGRQVAQTAPSRAAAGLPEAGFVFCCFNNHYKIHPPVFDHWMRMMHAVDGSVLWLADGAEIVRRNLREEARKRGISGDRLLFAPRLPDMRDHLARYRIADLFLDTLPFNAHSTASDALLAGLPVLTHRGATFAGRVGASLLTAAGLPELITESWEAYETLGVTLARAPERHAELRRRLNSGRGAGTLFDGEGYRRGLETLYQTAWERAVRGEAPESFSL